MACALFQCTLGKTAGGGTYIQHHPSGQINAKLPQRTLQLVGGAADEMGGIIEDFQSDIRIIFLGCFGSRFAFCQHMPLGNQLFCPVSTADQSPGHQQLIQSHLFSHGIAPLHIQQLLQHRFQA